MTLNKLVLSVFVFVLGFAPFAQAEIDIDSPRAQNQKQSSTRKHTTTIIEKEEDVQDEEEPVNAQLPKENEITAKFGSKATSGMAGCKTEELSKKLVHELKSDCSAWLKDRKAELKGKYLTGSCDESCDDCGMHSQRCSVNGVVRYTVKTVN